MAWLRRALGMLLALCAAAAALALLTDALGGSPALMLAMLEAFAPPEASGLAAEDYPAAAAMIAGYLSGARESFQLSATVGGAAVEAAFNAREQAHMADVAGLFCLARGVGLGCTAACLPLGAALWLLRRRDGQGWRGFRAGVALALGALAGLALWGLADFDGLFVAFHRLAFANDLWLLDPETDLLIRLMPTGFFAAYALVIAGTWLALGLLALGAAQGAVKRCKRKDANARGGAQGT